MGHVADYQYANNALVPFGIPTKITVGRHWFWYSKIILIEELVYGHADDPQNTFSAESKYESPKLPTLYQFDGGKEKLVRQGYEPPMPKPKE